jgi:hypothetical protein
MVRPTMACSKAARPVSSMTTLASSATAQRAMRLPTQGAWNTSSSSPSPSEAYRRHGTWPIRSASGGGARSWGRSQAVGKRGISRHDLERGDVGGEAVEPAAGAAARDRCGERSTFAPLSTASAFHHRGQGFPPPQPPRSPPRHGFSWCIHTQEAACGDCGRKRDTLSSRVCR